MYRFQDQFLIHEKHSKRKIYNFHHIQMQRRNVPPDRNWKNIVLTGSRSLSIVGKTGFGQKKDASSEGFLN